MKKLAPNNISTGNVGVMSLPRSRYQQVQAFPFQLPGNAVRIIQSPGPATTIAQPIPTTREASAVNNQTRMFSPAPTVFAPPSNFVAVSSANTPSAETVKVAVTDPTPLLQQTTLLTAQPNSLQMPQIPCVFPVSYVMYPSGVPANNMQLALQPPAKMFPANNVVVQQSLPSLKRPASPQTSAKQPSRNNSNGSASSTTLSVDSTDMDGTKNNHNQPKKARVDLLPTASVSTAEVAVGPRLAQSQFIVPSNPGFMLATPSSNGFSLPFNVLGYPLPAYPGATGLQALPIPAGVAQGQALHGISQVWFSERLSNRVSHF